MAILHATTQTDTSPSVMKTVSINASAKGVSGYMNNLSFRGKWPGKKERETHMSVSFSSRQFGKFVIGLAKRAGKEW